MSINKPEKLKSPEYWPAVVLLLLCSDAVAVSLSYLLALWLRFGRVYWQIPESYLRAWKQFAPLYTALCLGVFAFVGLYSRQINLGRLWRLLCFCSASLMASVAHAALITTLWYRMPNSYLVGGAALQFFFVVCIRLLIWLVFRLMEMRKKKERDRLALKLLNSRRSAREDRIQQSIDYQQKE